MKSHLILGLVMMIMGTAAMTSCVDEDLDVKKMSNTLQIGQGFGVPAGTAEFSIMDLLDKYDKENNPTFNIATYPDGSIIFEYTSDLKLPNPLKYKPDVLPSPLPDSVVLPVVSATINYDMMNQLPDGCIIKPHIQGR